MRLRAATRIERRLVLAGGGHAHVSVLRALAMRPEPGLDITLVAKELDAPYSGMLPGYVAGHYDSDECHIDLVRLAHFAGARVIHGEVTGIDPKRRQVKTLGRPPLTFDLLSIDVGITPALDDIAGAAEHAVAVKPVSTFAPKWQALEARALEPSGPRRIAIIGTGAAGFELVLAIRHRLRTQAVLHGISPDAFAFALVGAGGLLPTHNRRAQAIAAVELERAGVEVITGDAAIAVEPGRVRLASGRHLTSDVTLITTKATAPPWFQETGLALDPAGFLAVQPTLQVIGEDDIFAVGDCAAVIEHPREKAGVFAVRQGAPLTENLRLRARGMAARPFVPQQHFLTLLSCGEKSAIAARGRFSAAGRWAWKLKDRIDRDFMRRFQDLPAPMSDAGTTSDAMLCAGCAAKLGPAPLSRALARFEAAAPRASGPIHTINLAPRDDAAVLDLGGGSLRLESIDHFPAIWPEPYVLGEIAAAHALGDILAKGGTPDHALAIAGLPPAASHLQEDDLFQLLAGARAVLQQHGVELVGGHTARGEEASIGFFVSGSVSHDRLLRKDGLRGGEVLILTKPLGTGIIFAAWMRRMARAAEVAAALVGMRHASAAAARIFSAHGATAATDITGFGLAGHLIEMLDASAAKAVVGLAACPRYPGVDRLIAMGIRSSLLPENLAIADRLAIEADDAEAALALLFDPQTSGGLLAGVPADTALECLAALKAEGVEAAAIGTVASPRQALDGPALRVHSGLPIIALPSADRAPKVLEEPRDTMKTS